MYHVIVKTPEGGYMIRYLPNEVIKNDEELIHEATTHRLTSG